MPVDPDADAPGPPGASPPVRGVLRVLAGGAVGPALRQLLAPAGPDLGGVPVAVLSVNVAGAFALGLITAALAARGPDVGRRRDLRLLVGTGCCGGFTTYSALAVGVATLAAAGRAGSAIAYLTATVVLGGLATWGGALLGAGTRR